MRIVMLREPVFLASFDERLAKQIVKAADSQWGVFLAHLFHELVGFANI